jgi:hypothetical protein
MFRIARRIRSARVPPSAARPPSGETPQRLPSSTRYVPYLLCVARRLDLLTAMRERDTRVPDMPPIC